jgi:Rrf2 family protein
VTILLRKGLFAIAAVVDVSLQTDGRPISAKTLARRHALSPRHLESLLQSLVREGILRGIRGPNGGYELARDRRGVTANDILRAAGTAYEAGEELNSAFVGKVVLPVLSVCRAGIRTGVAISLDDMGPACCPQWPCSGSYEGSVESRVDDL